MSTIRQFTVYHFVMYTLIPFQQIILKMLNGVSLLDYNCSRSEKQIRDVYCNLLQISKLI